MKLVEYRIVLPLTVEEYHLGQLFMVARASAQETGDGEGIEVLRNEPYNDENGKGQFTHKKVHLASKIPGWVKSIVPSLRTIALDELAWNEYPDCVTAYSCDWFGSKLNLEVVSHHRNDKGNSDNVFGLSQKELKKRTVVFVDLSKGIDETAADYDPKMDPRKFVSEKTGRGPFVEGWQEREDIPVMTCYKLCRVEYNQWGLQTRGENLIQETALHDVFRQTHRQLICWLDEWHGMTMRDIRQLEREIAIELAQGIHGSSASATESVENNNDGNNGSENESKRDNETETETDEEQHMAELVPTSDDKWDALWQRARSERRRFLLEKNLKIARWSD